MALLRIENLSAEFRSKSGLFVAGTVVRAVNDVSLSIDKGKTLGLVGESGSGKTTLARSILRLVEPTVGRVLFQGEDILQVTAQRLRELRRDIQVVFQDPYQSLNPRMTVSQIIAEGWHIHASVLPRKQWSNRIAELLQMVGLSPDDRHKYPGEFSGGQRQRIGIARALALNPKLIICDEPVSALDLSVQAQVVNLLRDIQEQAGVALLFVAHDLAVVRHIANDVAVMYLGGIVEIGPSSDVLGQSRHPYTRALLSSVPIDHPAQRGSRGKIQLTGDPPSPASPPTGCRFRTRCWKAEPDCAETVPELITRPGSAHPVACVHVLDEVP